MLTTLITGAPDMWVEPAPVGMPALGNFFIITVVLAIFAAIVSLALLTEGHSSGLWVVLAAIVFGLTAVFTFSAADAENKADLAAQATQTTGYAEDVSDWLDDSYGINVSDDALWRLIDGETLATDYDGDRIVISFTTTSDDELALVDENLALVPELNR